MLNGVTSSGKVRFCAIVRGLRPNYPNPFNPSTTIEFTLPAQAEVSLEIYTSYGERVATLVHGEQDAGTHRVRWNGRNDNSSTVSSGVYICRLSAGAFTAHQSLLLVK